MESFYTEKVIGPEEKIYEVKLFDLGAKNLAAINILTPINGEEYSDNLFTFQYEYNIPKDKIMEDLRFRIKNQMWTN